MTNTAWLSAAGILLFVIAGAVFFFIGRKLGRNSELKRQQQAKATAEETAKRIIGEAERESESLRKTSILSGKEELMKLREDWELEVRSRREEIEREERKVDDHESQLNRKYDLLEQRERETARRTETVASREKTLGDREQELDKLLGEERRRLEQLAGLSAGDAKAELMHRMEEEGWISSFWGDSENKRRAKYYRLTKAGLKQLEGESRRWNRISWAIAQALEAS